MNLRKYITWSLSLLALAAFLVVSVDAQSKRRLAPKPRASSQTVPPGKWGGAEIRVTVKQSVTDIEFSCADGSIPRRLTMDKDGAFRIAGTYTGRSHGPIRLNSPPKAESVNYVGKIKGNRMSLTLDFANGDDRDLSFSLEKGADGRLVRCY
jgi:hypothetical protein